MEDKYHLSVEENLFLAKRTLSENVFSLLKTEPAQMTFSQVKSIIDGDEIEEVDIDELQKVHNLIKSWEYLLSTINNETNLEFLCKMNGFVAYNESLDWGVLRNGDISIGGISHIPKIPKKEEVEESIKEILSNNSVTEKAIDLCLYGMKNQLFWDGNKRTSLIIANKILISEGKGILTIPESQMDKFNINLKDFYETNSDHLKIFFYEKCIHN